MPLGIYNTTGNISIDSITNLATNITDPMEIFINMNHTLYGGNFYAILLFLFWAIILLIAWNSNKERKGFHDLAVYVMYSGALTTIVSFFFRAIFVMRDGVYYGLINDYQLWIFPIITILIATFIWMTQEN